MFTLTVHDEQVYRRLMERVEQRGESLDAVLRELLEQEEPSGEALSVSDEDEQTETPAQKLLRLIDETDLPFTNSFDARDAGDILRREAGDFSWRESRDNDGTT